MIWLGLAMWCIAGAALSIRQLYRDTGYLTVGELLICVTLGAVGGVLAVLMSAIVERRFLGKVVIKRRDQIKAGGTD